MLTRDCGRLRWLSCKRGREKVYGEYHEKIMNQNEESGIAACGKVQQVHIQASLNASTSLP